MDARDVSVPEPPAVATAVFGDRLELVRRFVHHLATTGTSWGLVGPREAPRLWERHVLNCAVMTDLLPDGARVADIGSGAGLPGLVLALRRPDLDILLVEPLLRRVNWLELVVNDLALPNVQVHRARAEKLHGSVRVDVVTARAVAPLDRLAAWGLPLLGPAGQLLALKGRTATDEVAQHAQAITTAGGVRTEVLSIGAELLDEPVTVVRVRVGSKGRAATVEQPTRSGRRRELKMTGPRAAPPGEDAPPERSGGPRLAQRTFSEREPRVD